MKMTDQTAMVNTQKLYNALGILYAPKGGLLGELGAIVQCLVVEEYNRGNDSAQRMHAQGHHPIHKAVTRTTVLQKAVQVFEKLNMGFSFVWIKKPASWNVTAVLLRNLLPPPNAVDPSGNHLLTGLSVFLL